MERGIEAKIFRLGVVTGNPNSGGINKQDFFVHFQSALERMGSMPYMRDMDFIPVDFIAKSVVGIGSLRDEMQMIYHLSTPDALPLETLKEWAQLGGTKLELRSYTEWEQEVEQFFITHPEDSLIPYKPLISSFGGKKSFLEILLRAPPVSTVRTQEALKLLNLSFPELSQELLFRYRDAYLANGFLGEDSSDSLFDSANMFGIIEDMSGYIALVEEGHLPLDRYRDAFEKGRESDYSFRIDFRGHVPSLVTLFTEKKIYLNGHIFVPLLHEKPLRV